MKKKIIFVINILIILLLNINSISIAKEDTNNVDTNAIIQSQSNNLNISSFLNETKKYSTDVLGDINMSTILSDAISGKIDNTSILKNILQNFFKESLSALTSIGIIIVIVVIHSILKNISDGLEENSTTSKLTYYVAYIMIVAVIMKNFADIINMIKTAIENMVGFINCLFPLLISLMLTTGSIKSATLLQPMILFISMLVGNVIVKVVIPFALISLALSIISNISDKVQISKLSKFINSATVWVLGIILTLFVTVASLEGSITKGVDSVTVKTTKAAVSGCIPVVGKILR